MTWLSALGEVEVAVLVEQGVRGEAAIGGFGCGATVAGVASLACARDGGHFLSREVEAADTLVP